VKSNSGSTEEVKPRIQESSLGSREVLKLKILRLSIKKVTIGEENILDKTLSSAMAEGRFEGFLSMNLGVGR